MQRFFLETTSLGETEIILQDEEIIYQLVKVLRSKVWDEVIFFNGKEAKDFIYTITSIDKRNIIFSFVQKIEKLPQKCELVLFQSLPNKIDKIEEIIAKGTEVWYSEFHFFRSERSQDLKLSPNKIQRFEKIIKEASEQSGRNILPKLSFLEKLDMSHISGEILFFHTDMTNSKRLKDISFDKYKKINIFVWPEWGFSDRENQFFLQNNATKIYLWENILRTQNTPVVVWFYILQQ